MTARPTYLRAVPKPAAKPPEPSLEYEWKQRQDIAARDWSRVHIAADRRRPIFIPDRIKRLWR